MANLETVLVTGGAGFIGSYVVDRLLKDGKRVLVLDHTGHQELMFEKDNVTLFLGDMRDETTVFEAVSHADAFIHLAGVLGTQETIAKPTPAIMTNITGGLNILEAAARYGVPGVNIAVGNHWENNPYSISKSTVERLVRMFNDYRHTNVSIVRALNAYGPRQSVAAPYGPSKVRKIMPSFVMRALHGDDIEIYGDGNQIMDMIYVADVADMLVDALYHTNERGHFEGVIEAGTGADTTVNDIAEAVLSNVRAQGIPTNSKITHIPLRAGETPGAVVKADVSTQEQLYPEGKSLTTLGIGVGRTVAYYREQLNKQHQPSLFI